MTPPPSDASAPAPERVHLTILAVQTMFAALPVAGRVVLEHLSPFALAALRVGLATPLLLFLAYRHDRLIPPRREWGWLALLGFLGVFLNQVLYLKGLSYTTATNATILISSIPVFTVGIGMALGLERVAAARAGGILLAVAGALVLLDARRLTLLSGPGGNETSFGNLLILTNCLCYAAFLVMQRPVLARLPWRTVIAWAFLFGSLGVLAVSTGPLAELEPLTVPARAWWGLAFIVVFPTVLAYSLSSWAIRRSSPSTVAAYTTVQPLLTALMAAAVLGEQLAWRQAGGFALIVAGLWLTNRVRESRPV